MYTIEITRGWYEWRLIQLCLSVAYTDGGVSHVKNNTDDTFRPVTVVKVATDSLCDEWMVSHMSYQKQLTILHKMLNIRYVHKHGIYCRNYDHVMHSDF